MTRHTLARAAAAAALLAAAGAACHLAWHGPSKTETRVEIPPGSGMGAIGRRLAEAGAVRHAWVFRAYALLTGRARELQAGEYAFASRPGLERVVAALAAGRTVRHRLVVPEGFTAAQVAERLEAEGLADAEAFLDAAGNSVLARRLGVPAPSLEGFLFPDTYALTKGMSPEAIAERMVGRYREIATPERLAAAAEAGLDELAWVTLASIIEREVRVDAERAKAAGVFLNRLARNMRLESCATVLYSQGRTAGTVSLEDLETRSPYNTYRRGGLPPGPIGNPGLASLEAAAHPADTDALFFVVRPDGRHVFSETFEEHKRAKWRQKRLRRREPTPTRAPESP